jgi:hypothetical protein
MMSTSVRTRSRLFTTACRTVATLLVTVLLIGTSQAAEDAKTSADGEDAESKLAKETQNPVANLISVPFQNNLSYGAGTKGNLNNPVWVLNVQPVIPFHISDDWNLITRTILPIINQPSLFPHMENVFGMGDINPTVFLSPAKPSKFIWGVGPTMTFPTGTDKLLTSGKYSAGPAAVGLFMDGPWVVGALVNQQWSFAGWGDHDVNAMLIQPFLNYNLPKGWYLSTAPIMTANFAAGSSGNHWTVPAGGGFGKLWRIGKVGLPLNTQVQAFYNAVKPDFGADWQLRLQLQFLFPS